MCFRATGAERTENESLFTMGGRHCVSFCESRMGFQVSVRLRVAVLAAALVADAGAVFLGVLPGEAEVTFFFAAAFGLADCDSNS